MLTESLGPRVNGVALLEKFQAQADTKDIPFIFVTRQTDQVRPLAQTQGSIDIVDKPALMSEILDAVSRNITLPESGSIRLAETVDFRRASLGSQCRLSLMPSTISSSLKKIGLSNVVVRL